jgi:hypothetical protein
VHPFVEPESAGLMPVREPGSATTKTCSRNGRHVPQDHNFRASRGLGRCKIRCRAGWTAPNHGGVDAKTRKPGRCAVHASRQHRQIGGCRSNSDIAAYGCFGNPGAAGSGTPSRSRSFNIIFRICPLLPIGGLRLLRFRCFLAFPLLTAAPVFAAFRFPALVFTPEAAGKVFPLLLS